MPDCSPPVITAEPVCARVFRIRWHEFRNAPVVPENCGIASRKSVVLSFHERTRRAVRCAPLGEVQGCLGSGGSAQAGVS